MYSHIHVSLMIFLHEGLKQLVPQLNMLYNATFVLMC